MEQLTSDNKGSANNKTTKAQNTNQIKNKSSTVTSMWVANMNMYYTVLTETESWIITVTKNGW